MHTVNDKELYFYRGNRNLGLLMLRMQGANITCSSRVQANVQFKGLCFRKHPEVFVLSKSAFVLKVFEINSEKVISLRTESVQVVITWGIVQNE